MSDDRVTLRFNRAATIANMVAAPLLLGWGIFYIMSHEPDWLTIAWSAMFILGGLYGFSRTSLRLTIGPEGFTYSGPLAHRKTIRWDDVRLIVTKETQSGTVPEMVFLENHMIGPDIRNYASSQLAMPVIARYLPPSKIRDHAEWQASRR